MGRLPATQEDDDLQHDAPAVSTPRVLLVDPALRTLVGRFAERLPADVSVEGVSTFELDELNLLASAAVVFVNARRRIDRETIASAPALRLVQMIGVGTDPLDLDALAEAGVAAAYNPGVNRTGAAEHTIMLMLALIKRLPASDRATREGRFLPGEIISRGIDDLADATVGIVGMGHIGQAMRYGYSTHRGLGVGLPGAKLLMDEFDIVSEVGVGTTITMKKWLGV